MIPADLQSINNIPLSSSSVVNVAPVFNSDRSQSSITQVSHSPQCCTPPPLAPVSTRPAFEDTLSTTPLPPPGPAYYAARRALWLTPVPEAPLPPVPSTSRQRLEHLLSMPGAVESEEVWESGVEKVWKGLVAGGRLKRRLPMNLVIKILHAGWIRDPETWPAGAVVPETDDMDEHSEFQSIPRPLTEHSSGATTPQWTAASGTVEDGIEGSAGRRASGMVGVAGF